MTQLIDVTELDNVPVATHATTYRTAKLSEFRAPAPKLLFGERLKEIVALEASIQEHGLMRPLKVTRSGDKLVVIDGRKRLCALRRMRFKNTLPRSLVNIPFVLSTEPVPHVLSAQDQYRQMMSFKTAGLGHSEVATTLCISPKRLHALESVNRLSPRLKQAFLDATISLDQACAFSALPWHEAQDSLLLSLGPFSSAAEILKAISEQQRKDLARAPLREKVSVKANNIIAMPTPPLAGLSQDAFSQTPQIAA